MIKTSRDIHDEDLSRASVKEELRKIAEEHKYLTGCKRNENVVEAAAMDGNSHPSKPAGPPIFQDPALVALNLRLRGGESDT